MKLKLPRSLRADELAKNLVDLACQRTDRILVDRDAADDKRRVIRVSDVS